MSENQLLVGFARVDITPKESVPLAGYGNTAARYSKVILDHLTATCIAFTQGEDTVLLFTQDLVCTNHKWARPIRERIEKELGVPADRIFIHATHTHSAPDTLSQEPAIVRYQPLHAEQLFTAAREALADRSPAQLFGTKTLTNKNLNAIRHYRRADGTVVGDNFGYFSKAPIVGHVEDSDREMRIIKVQREEEGKKDILLVNWQAHPAMTGGGKRYNMSADFPGMLRNELEYRTDMQVAYFTAAAGNHNTRSRIEEEKHGKSYIGVACKLADAVEAALPDLQLIGGSGIATRQVQHVMPVNHAEEDRIEDARRVRQYWLEIGDTATGNKLARELGFHSVYHASAILARPDRPKTDDAELNAGRIGDLAFVTAPCEMFKRTGVNIRANSPFDMTLVISLTNERVGYFPTADAFDYGCYESQTSYFAKGVAESVEAKLTELLKEL